MPPLRPILVAEDDPNDIELILTALEKAEISNTITIARDGEAVLDFLHRRGAYAGRTSSSPAVILLDLKIPRVDGRDVLRQIRADPELCSIPIVVLTSSREESDMRQSYELGANAYLVKPVDFDDFSDAVSKLGLFWALINEPSPH